VKRDFETVSEAGGMRNKDTLAREACHVASEVGPVLLTVDRKQSIFYRTSIRANKKMSKMELLQGTLDMLILNALRSGPYHGLGVSRRIHQITQGAFDVRPGSLFPALHRLEEKGWLASRWGESENNRRAKYYQLTAAGKRQLQAETETWERVSLIITRALRTT
jgi:transcriptional regulator